MENLELCSGIATTDNWLKATEGMKIDAFEITSLSSLVPPKLENAGSIDLTGVGQLMVVSANESMGTSSSTPLVIQSNPIGG